MRFDIVLAGVGGQDVLSMAALIGRAALAEGLYVKLSEVHGMAQRGGAVQAHLRLSDRPIESDLIAAGTAQLILSLEPIEGLRHLASLAPSGTLVTSSNPFRNIRNYPPLETVLAKIGGLPHAFIVDAERVAARAGDIQAVNTAMVGAVARLLPLRFDSLEEAVRETSRRNGEAVLAANLAALLDGADASRASVPAGHHIEA